MTTATQTAPRIGLRMIEAVTRTQVYTGKMSVILQRVVVCERPASGDPKWTWVLNADDKWQPKKCHCTMGEYDHNAHYYKAHDPHPHGVDPQVLTVWNKSERSAR